MTSETALMYDRPSVSSSSGALVEVSHENTYRMALGEGEEGEDDRFKVAHIKTGKKTGIYTRSSKKGRGGGGGGHGRAWGTK